MKLKNTDLSGNAFHDNSGNRRDGTPLGVIERALWMIQAGQGSDLFLGQSGFIGRLKGEENDTKKKQTEEGETTVKILTGKVTRICSFNRRCAFKKKKRARMRLIETSPPEAVWNQKSS